MILRLNSVAGFAEPALSLLGLTPTQPQTLPRGDTLPSFRDQTSGHRDTEAAHIYFLVESWDTSVRPLDFGAMARPLARCGRLRVVLLALLGICRSGPRPGHQLASAGAAEAAARGWASAFVRSPGSPWVRRPQAVVSRLPSIRTCVQCLRGSANNSDRRVLSGAGSEGASDAPLAARWKVKRAAAAGRGQENEQGRSTTHVETQADPNGVEEVMTMAAAAVRSETRVAGPGRRRGGGRGGGPGSGGRGTRGSGAGRIGGRGGGRRERQISLPTLSQIQTVDDLTSVCLPLFEQNTSSPGQTGVVRAADCARILTRLRQLGGDDAVVESLQAVGADAVARRGSSCSRDEAAAALIQHCCRTLVFFMETPVTNQNRSDSGDGCKGTPVRDRVELKHLVRQS